MSKKKITDNFFRWDWSGFSASTAYFYFKKYKKVLCVEYWTDEDKVAEYAQYFTIDGDEIEDDGKYLTEHEKSVYAAFCKNEILKEQ